MISLLVIGLLIALVAYFMLAKTWGNEPKAKKQEKAEIIRQLLALSEREDRIASALPPSKLQGNRRGFVSTSRKS
jgi:hypothetical protein